MALVACKECGKDVSTEALACPHCGAPRRTQSAPPSPKKTSGCAKFAAGFVILFVGAMVYNDMKKDADQREQAAQRAAMTPQQKAESDKQAATEAAAKAKKEVAFQKVVSVIRGIKATNRNPDSVVWESIRANDDASIICVEYRGQNGFGGMSRETVTVAKGAVSQKPAAWNKHCTQPLNDLIYARRAL